MNDGQALTNILNEPQHTAVSAPASNILVLAGAGSGKTRVLAHRIAWLIQHEGLSPFSILAVTFTNKAAYEMRSRIESLLGMSLSTMWVGTFHGLAHRLLRIHYQAANLVETFQIIDSADQLSLVRRLMRNLQIDDKRWPPKQCQWFINSQKQKGVRANDVPNHDNSYFTETMCRVYQAYESLCQRTGLVDFAELLLRSLELLQQDDSIRDHYQSRFAHILVDEFQDTNTIQYDWLSALKSPSNYMMAVGDDDQSIYSWRGARIDHIHRFSQDFSDVNVIRLEQNYRSTQTILQAANAVIAHNHNRLGKKLWTTGESGALIHVYAAMNERDEAYYIADKIKRWLQDRHASEVAILYRSNAQSRILEEQLIDAQIPYRIYGGLKFFERAEIKDALAYLRLLTNRDDDAAFERVVNTPTRGIGNATLAAIRTLARDHNTSLWQTTEQLIADGRLSTRASNALAGFLELINHLNKQVADCSLDEQVKRVLASSGLLDHFKKDTSEQGISRVENLEELVNATASFKPEQQLELSPLAAFLTHVALETGEEQASAHSDCVHLMTLHAAKGLEFPVVFICGVEEELFPHKMSLDEHHGLEEERRLCYVGMTRAMEKLILTHAECRRMHGVERYTQPSRFIAEIPSELMHTERPYTKVKRTGYRHAVAEQAGDTGFCVGQRVRHNKFGVGTILNYEGAQSNTRIQVKFDQHGTKWLVAAYAKLEAEY